MSDQVFPDREDQRGIYYSPKGGLTKRELFAAMAMQGLLAEPAGKDAATMIAPSGKVRALFAEAAVVYADALIAALAKEPEK